MRIITTALIAALALTACGTTDLPDQEWFVAMEDTASDMDDTASDMDDTADDTDEFLLEGTAHGFEIQIVSDAPEVFVHIMVEKSDDSDFGPDDFTETNTFCSEAFGSDCQILTDPENGIVLNQGVESFHHVAAVHNTGATPIDIDVTFGVWTTTLQRVQPDEMRCAGVVDPTNLDVEWAPCTDEGGVNFSEW